MAQRERSAVGEALVGEIVVFDPEDEDTYPSVCVQAEEVEARFGFTGGEVLLFDAINGSYIGQIVKRLGEEQRGEAERE